MHTSRTHRGFIPRLRPLAAGLALALFAPSLAAMPPAVDGVQAIERIGERLQAATFERFAARLRARAGEPDAAPPGHVPATQMVSNCNDSGGGSLRAAVGAAVDGDTVSMSTLGCSLITLSSGAIAIHANNLTIVGRGQQTLTIDAGNASGVFLHYGNGTLAISDMTLSHGYYGLGGCVTSVGNLSLARTTVSACTATGYGGYTDGGGIFVNGNLTMSASTLANNTAWDPAFSGDRAYGGGALVKGHATISGSTIHANTATASFNYAGGGGMVVVGTLALDTSTISGNTAIDVGGIYAAGGGVFAAADATITASTIEGNHGSVGGGVSGGVASSAIVVVDSTISGNDAFLGGGLVTPATLHLKNSTVALNYSGGGAGGAGVIVTANGEFQSSIVANNNAVGASASADLASQGHSVSISGADNLVRAADAALSLPSGTLHVDPMLAAFLENNGGPTQTLALNANSPAIDAGNNAAGLATDQRGSGFARVSGAHADIGAYEFQSGGDEIFGNGFDP